MQLLKKIVDNEELTECMKSDPVIYVCCSKDLKLLRTKKCTEGITSALGIDVHCMSKNKVNTARTSFMNQARSI